jgi:DNA-binding NarL/FixJ family response regulator
MTDGRASMSGPKKYRVLIVDDHPIVRRGLADLIAARPDLEVCGEAADVAEGLRLVEATRPDVVVVDLTLKDGHGLDLIEEIKARFDRVKMLVSSMHDESLFAERALRAGASGYIGKGEPPDRIIDALHRVLRGEICLSPRMANRLLHRVASGEALEKNPIEGLSDREIQVFEMIGQGHTTKQIAQSLKLSHKTIEAHREKIKAKLELKNSSELARHATQWVLERG